MDKDVADKVIKTILAAGVELDRLDSLSDAIHDEEEKKAYRRCLGTVMATLYTDMMMPIIGQYPDLDPDK